MMIGNGKIWIFMLMLVSFVMAADDDAWDSHKCNATVSCPKSKPCCSQYGVCGTGAYCLGGCDIRFSFSLDSCMPQPIMEEYKNDFKDKKIFKKQDEYLGHAEDTDWIYTGWIDNADDALLLQMPNGSTGTVISSTKYVWYGKISATMKSSRDKGVISAFILFSDVQDEIDYEFVGYDLTHPQSNYYSLGILDYLNSENTSVSNTFENYHDYEIDWQEDKIDWYIDDKKVRTLLREDTYNKTTKTYDFPQTPSRVQFSLWPGGDSRNGLGTIEWAGGAINWDSEDIQEYGYYYALVKSVKIEPYDFPDFVAKNESDDGGDNFDAFLYNSTKGSEKNIYLTNKKTWLGSGDATGLDPDNESDDEDEDSETTIVETSGSTTHTRTSSRTKSSSSTSRANTVVVPGEETNAAAATTSNLYNPSAGVGGFVQNTEETSTPDSGSGSGGSSSSGSGGSQTAVEGFFAFFAIIIGFLII